MSKIPSGARALQPLPPPQIASVSEPNDAHEVCVTFGAPPDVGKFTLTVSYVGLCSDTELHGVYQCTHPKSKESVTMTHLEPAFAKETFVCLDDFSVRPRWTLELQVRVLWGRGGVGRRLVGAVALCVSSAGRVLGKACLSC